MNWRQFTVALVQSLAWPSVALVVLLVYRRRVSQLLGDNLRRLKAGPIEAEWERVAEETRATIEAAEAIPALSESEPQLPPEQKLLRLARAYVHIDPTIAIVHANHAARIALEAHLPMDDEGLRQSGTLNQWMRWAQARDLIDPGLAVVFMRLQRLGNLAHHPLKKRTAKQAEEYLQMVEEFLALVEHSAAVMGRPVPAARGQAEGQTSDV